MRKQIIIYLSTFLLLILITVLLIFYGKGYIFDFQKGKIEISVNGLLAATSQPDGAGIYINDHLTSATNNTISLSPGEYDVKIVKEGYFPWRKKIKIEKEVVSSVYALLFPTAPRLESITDTGVSNPTLDPSRTKLAYTVSSFDSVRKNGVYILDMSLRPILTLQSSSSQIADDTLDAFSKALLSWSPDAEELLATISGQLNATYLLKTNFNENPQDVTQTLDSVADVWSKEKIGRERSKLASLKPKLRNLINEDFKIISWSLDETKILYSATDSATLPIIINPRLIGANSTPEDRILKKGSIYVYDIKEDRNYKILDSLDNFPSSDYENKLPIKWFTDSKHLIYVNNKKIDIMEYDGQNSTTIYAGPFVDGFVFAWPDGSKLVMLTSLGNPNIAPNLYTISLK
ncbi:PEGA domain-containing protein [Candidatus Roizmanbacteria bacterium]|nr:PEGA domain-containing protein [Candidatus Roizmanbacteria bacterium]